MARLALTVVGTVLIAEAVVRFGRPTPRTLVIRLDQAVTSWEETAEGVPLWRTSAFDDRYRNEDCPGPDSFDIALAGDSILYTTAHGAEEAIASLLLQERLSGRTPRVCVLNVSQPAYFPYQQLAELERVHARHGIDLAIVGVWKQPHAFTRVGDTLYEVARLRVDALGTPVLPWLPMPASWRRALFGHSRLFEYASLALAPLRRGGEAEGLGFPDMARWTRQHGMDALFVEMTPLAQPFSDYATARRGATAPGADDTTPVRHRAAVEAAVRAEGVDYEVLAYALEGDDVEALRLDTCCHFNEAGHARLAEVLEGWVVPRLPTAD